MSSSEPEAAAPIAQSGHDDHGYVIPCKKIKNPMALGAWEKSQTYSDFLGFIHTLNESVKGIKISEAGEPSETCAKLLSLLETLNHWIDEIPPTDQPQRFGNKAFRDWHKRLSDNSESIILTVMPVEHHKAVIELKAYLEDSFGNSVRIDYGSGHEMNFAAFLCCLYKLRVLTDTDSKVVALNIFNRYLELVRRLQTTYRMEPAGSHGVWGLDDFQFIPYIWGSAQLIDHPSIQPKDFHDCGVAQSNAKEYMYMRCIEYIHQCKNGPFFEHSPTLWGMTSVQHWQKINTGLMKMYKAEVLIKFPIVQHFLFGTILTLDPAT
ncbi:serine/threonine-protein phosphatase 2A activator-like [Asterias amurensis]|uniref:serine/threonine-protein phosphatase 2A activator-like n=1 Tax=Asterias amurensis TaxID=7602 RepID=UPI003AB702A2